MKSRRSLSALFASPDTRDAPVAWVGQHAVTFDAFERDVSLLAAALQIKDGDRWLLASSNAYALAVGLLGTLHAGFTAVLPANLQIGHLGNLAADLDGVLVHEQAVPDGLDGQPILDRASDGPRVTLGAIDPGTAKVILQTSGTTGEPLAVAKTLACFEAELAALDQQFELSDPDVVLATVPAHHIYGLLFRVLWPLAAGRAFQAEMVHFPGELAHVLKGADRSLLISSPAFLTRALEILDLGTLDRRLAGIFSSGGPLPPEIGAAYNAKLTHPVVEVYGSTETGGIGFRSVHDATVPTPWRPLPGVALLAKPDEGTLTVQSPFLHDVDCFETNDRAKLHQDGSFELLGRADRIVKVEERRVSLVEVEQRLAANPAVSAARVLSLAGSGHRNALAAVVQPTSKGWELLATQGKRALTENLRAAIAPFLDTTALPKKWRFVTALPESSQGKVPLAALAALFDAGESGASRPIVLDREVGPSTLNLKLEMQPDLIYFDGHFDEHAVLPGVVQLDWAINFAREAFGFTQSFERVEALKFFQVICANERVDLELRFEPERSRLHFRYSGETHDHSAGRVLFEGTA